MEPVTWAFVGTIVGAFSSIATTSITNWNNFRIQKNTKTEERIERSKSFQRDTLVELQTEMIEYIRSLHLIHTEDLNAFNTSGNWGGQIPKDISDKNREISVKTSVLIERISNDELRTELKEIKDLSTKCLMAKSKEEAQTFKEKTINKYTVCAEKLGEVLRSNY